MAGAAAAAGGLQAGAGEGWLGRGGSTSCLVGVGGPNKTNHRTTILRFPCSSGVLAMLQCPFVCQVLESESGVSK